MKKFSIGDRVEIDGKNTGYISAMKKKRSKKPDSRWLYDISFSDFSDISENRIMAYVDRIMYTKNQKSLEGYLHSSYDTLNNKYNLELDNGKKINNCANADYEYYCDIVEVQTKENYWEKGYRIGANIKPNGEKMYQVLLLGDKGVLWPDVKNTKIRKNISEANVRSSYVEAHYDESKPIKIYGVYFDKIQQPYNTNVQNIYKYLNAPDTLKVLKYEIKDDSNRDLDSSGNQVKIKDDQNKDILFNIKTTTCQPVTAFNKSDQVKRSYIFVGLLLLFVVHFGMYYAFKYFHNNDINSLYVYGSGFFLLIIIVMCCIIFLAKPSFANTKYKNKEFNILNTVSWLLLGFTIVIIINLWIYFINDNNNTDTLFTISNPASPTFIDNIKSIGNLFKYSN